MCVRAVCDLLQFVAHDFVDAVQPLTSDYRLQHLCVRVCSCDLSTNIISFRVPRVHITRLYYKFNIIMNWNLGRLAGNNFLCSQLSIFATVTISLQSVLLNHIEHYMSKEHASMYCVLRHAAVYKFQITSHKSE